MRLMAIAVFTVLAIGSSTLSIAQTDAKAKVVLDKVSTKIKSLKTLKAKFTFSLKSSTGVVREKKSGEFFLKGNKYRVLIDNQEIICDNKSLWTYNKRSNEVQIVDYNPDEANLSPAKLFTN